MSNYDSEVMLLFMCGQNTENIEREYRLDLILNLIGLEIV